MLRSFVSAFKLEFRVVTVTWTGSRLTNQLTNGARQGQQTQNREVIQSKGLRETAICNLTSRITQVSSDLP